jgi:hypothetical protein
MTQSTSSNTKCFLSETLGLSALVGLKKLNKEQKVQECDANAAKQKYKSSGQKNKKRKQKICHKKL